MADPTVLPPQFAGRYPGAPLPVPPPVVPSQFVSRLPTGAPGTTSGAIPAFQPVQLAAPAVPAGMPIDTAALNAATQGAPLQAVTPTAPAPAATTNAVTPVAATPSPTIGADGQWNVPPLPLNMQGAGDGASGGVALPTDVASTAAGAGAGAGGTRAMPADPTLFDPFNQQGGASPAGGIAPAGGSPGTAGPGGRLIDPDAAQGRGYDRMLAYQQASINNLLSAFSRSDGLAATKHALAAAIGVNDFGQVAGQGANALNQSTAGIIESQQSADATVQAEKIRAQQQQYATDATREVGDVGTEANVPGFPQLGTHPVRGVIVRDTQGRATGASIPFKAVGGAVQGPQGTEAPTLSQYMSANKLLNPGVTDEELTARYNARFRKGQ